MQKEIKELFTHNAKFPNQRNQNQFYNLFWRSALKVPQYFCVLFKFTVQIFKWWGWRDCGDNNNSANPFDSKRFNENKRWLH